MTNYTKTTDFAAKDSLPSGDSGKIIRGSEFETEFDNIATAVNSKSDANNPTFTGTVTIDGLTVNGNTVLGNAATDTVTVTADIASNLIPSADDTYNLGASGAEWNDLYVDGTAHIDAINFNGTAITATAAELNYVDGVTSAIQTQLDSKANLSGANFTGSIDVTGTVTADGLTVDGDTKINSAAPKLTFVESDTTDLNARLRIAGGSFQYHTTNDAEDTFTRRLQIDNSTGDISFYEDTGTTAKFFWDASAESLGIGNSSFNAALHVEHANNYNSTNFEDSPHLTISNGSTTNHTSVLMFQSSGADVANKRSGITGGNYYSNKHGLAFLGDLSGKDRSADPDMFIGSSGSVGIGNSAPSTALDVSGTVTADSLTSEAGANATNILTLSGGAVGRTLTVQSYDTTLGGAGFDINATASAGELTLQTNTKDRLRIASNGDVSLFEDTGTNAKFFWDTSTERLGLGTDTPARKLTIQDDSAQMSLVSTTGSSVLNFGDTADDNIGRIEYSNSDNSMRFRTNADDAMRINSSGHLIVHNGVTLGTSAGTYVAANTLDDYEEGTWTPTLTDGTTTVTQTNKLGSYVKVGNIVSIFFQILDASVSGLTGSVKIGGLPFTTGNTRGNGVIQFNNVTDGNEYFAQKSGSNPFLELKKSSTTTSETAGPLPVGNFSEGVSDLFGSVTYII